MNWHSVALCSFVEAAPLQTAQRSAPDRNSSFLWVSFAFVLRRLTAPSSVYLSPLSLIHLKSLEDGIALFLLFGKHLVVLINNCDGQKNTRAASNRTQKICNDGQGANAHSAEGGCSGDVSI